MKAVALLAVFFSLNAFAADFPTGRFICTGDHVNGELKLAETTLGGMSLPLIEFTMTDGNYKRGLGTVTAVGTAKRSLFLHASASNFEIQIIADGTLKISGSTCIRQ